MKLIQPFSNGSEWWNFEDYNCYNDCPLCKKCKYRKAFNRAYNSYSGMVSFKTAFDVGLIDEKGEYIFGRQFGCDVKEKYKEEQKLVPVIKIGGIKCNEIVSSKLF